MPRTATLGRPEIPLRDVVLDTVPGRSVVRAADVGGPAAWQALVRDGVLHALTDDAACSVDALVDRGPRAAAVGPLLPRGAVATGRTAAWIHTGAGAPGPLELACAAGRHRPSRPPGARLWQAPLLHPDVELVVGVPVTDRTRTVVELALHGGDHVLVAELVRHGADLAAARRSVLLRPRAAGREEALATLDAAAAR